MNTQENGKCMPKQPGGIAAGCWTPPELPGPSGKAPREELFNSSFENDFGPVEGRMGFFRLVDFLLKSPARVAHSVVEGRSPGVLLLLSAAVLGGYLAYGIVMASFSGGLQYCFVPLKTVWGIVLTVCICFPSLYIFSSLAGAQQDVMQIAGLVLMSVAMSAILLLGFAPVTWVFSQSSGTLYFMGLLHLAVWGASAWFGYKLLARAMIHINGKSMSILRAWAFIFLIVAMQMTVNLRPLIGQHSDTPDRGKKFFLQYWMDQAKGR